MVLLSAEDMKVSLNDLGAQLVYLSSMWHVFCFILQIEETVLLFAQVLFHKKIAFLLVKLPKSNGSENEVKNEENKIKMINSSPTLF